MSRKQSRELAFRILFSLTYSSPSVEGVDARSADGVVSYGFDGIPDQKETEYINTLVDAVKNNLCEIDEIITKNSRGFSFERIFKTDLTALRMGIAELRFFNDATPAVVAVNEAVEIAKKYGTEKSGGFVNGILAQVMKPEA